jgi:hypothetical protein
MARCKLRLGRKRLPGMPDIPGNLVRDLVTQALIERQALINHLAGLPI